MIFFVLRLLKALDFQPRMALVTRTISSAFSDLLHFIALFAVIFFGYVIAGYLLFGHQFQSFSTLAYSCQFLVLVLLSFDPTQFWVQVILPYLRSKNFTSLKQTLGKQEPVFAQRSNCLLFFWVYVYCIFLLQVKLYC